MITMQDIRQFAEKNKINNFELMELDIVPENSKEELKLIKFVNVEIPFSVLLYSDLKGVWGDYVVKYGNDETAKGLAVAVKFYETELKTALFAKDIFTLSEKSIITNKTISRIHKFDRSLLDSLSIYAKDCMLFLNCHIGYLQYTDVFLTCDSNISELNCVEDFIV